MSHWTISITKTLFRQAYLVDAGKETICSCSFTSIQVILLSSSYIIFNNAIGVFIHFPGLRYVKMDKKLSLKTGQENTSDHSHKHHWTLDIYIKHNPPKNGWDFNSICREGIQWIKVPLIGGGGDISALKFILNNSFKGLLKWCFLLMIFFA